MTGPIRTHALETPITLAPASDLPAAAPSTAELPIALPVHAPPEVQHVTQMLLASGSSDPIEALMGVLHQIRAMNGERSRLDVESAEQSREIAWLNHEKAIEDAKAAAERRLNKAPRWLKWLVSTIVTAVGVVAAAFTGGTSLGLAIAGAALLLSAEGIAKLGVKLGMSPEAAGWLKLGIQVAGAALMLGAGFAGGAATALPKAVEVTEKSVQVVKATMDSIEASIGMVDANREYDQKLAEADADLAGLVVDGADVEVQAAVELLADGLADLRRQSEAFGKLSESKRAATESVLEGMRGGAR